MHSVDVDLREEGRRSGDDGGNEDLSDLTLLAQVAALNIPFDIFSCERPPKPLEEQTTHREDSTVTRFVMASA